jgi:hypothetical protein
MLERVVKGVDECTVGTQVFFFHDVLHVNEVLDVDVWGVWRLIVGGIKVDEDAWALERR